MVELHGTKKCVSYSSQNVVAQAPSCVFVIRGMVTLTLAGAEPGLGYFPLPVIPQKQHPSNPLLLEELLLEELLADELLDEKLEELLPLSERLSETLPLEELLPEELLLEELLPDKLGEESPSETPLLLLLDEPLLLMRPSSESTSRWRRTQPVSCSGTAGP